MECIMRAGARLNLAIGQLPETVACHDYDLSKPPEASAAWVEELCAHATLLKERLDQLPGLEHAIAAQVQNSPSQLVLPWSFLKIKSSLHVQEF